MTATADYRTLADQLSDDIREGRLHPGERLLPLREFAFRRGIAPSTASRVYAELGRRGLTVGEIGRGTFVRSASEPISSVLIEPPAAPIDLESNFPILEGQEVALAALVRKLVGSRAMKQAVRAVGAYGTEEAREVAASYLSRDCFAPQAGQLLFAAGGRQAIAAALSAIAGRGERVGIEAISYAVVKAIAAQLGISLVPIEMDSEGLCPKSLRDAHREASLRAVYVQPSVQNPLGCTMSVERRQELADVLHHEQLIAIEDGVYSFLADEPPLASFAPERTIFVESLSKRVAPGLTIGFIIPPATLVERIARAISSGGWGAAGFSLAAAVSSMRESADGDWVRAKRKDARHRQQIARGLFRDLAYRGDERAYHIWLELPPWWRADAFVGAALKRGIAVTPGRAFAVAPGHSPNAVRIALASPPEPMLRRALGVLVDLTRSESAWTQVE